MKAKDVMSTGVISVSESTSLEEAARTMLTHRISGLPVTGKDGSLVGMISEGDLLRRSELATERKRPKWLEFILGPGRLSEEYAHTHGRFVSEVMTRDVVSAQEDTELEDLVQTMQKQGIKRVPVIRDGRPVGMVSRADLLRALQGVLARKGAEPLPSDVAIRSAILSELETQTWTPKASVHVVVSGGDVTLSGCIFDDRERDALRVLAENIPGVKSVTEDLVTIYPYAEASIPPL
jgi:CBS domain-containing protein